MTWHPTLKARLHLSAHPHNAPHTRRRALTVASTPPNTRHTAHRQMHTHPDRNCTRHTTTQGTQHIKSDSAHGRAPHSTAHARGLAPALSHPPPYATQGAHHTHALTHAHTQHSTYTLHHTPWHLLAHNRTLHTQHTTPQTHTPDTNRTVDTTTQSTLQGKPDS